ncbi:hypothetical protein G6F47_009582 [Rhizopus delemar]|nr:hypothetical protein G6F54_007727 [Rhizopus delemar]KAG1506450.1 hypothetical protein G6F53_009677 [Rhizopus delemar]KAG1556263.1 hypothetical protein G6F49_006429 [Rhizopus delemar]KAG1581990.1 hypothetical protein G6F48_009452 [Rhizopus delemar]KAG1591951.1 hypothetical protein G6F47_009582 [Rhizopus delemar]
MKEWSAKSRTQGNSITINVSGVNRGIIIASSKVVLESHKVIRFGKKFPRPSLNGLIYREHIKNHQDASAGPLLSEICIKYIDTVIDSNTLNDFKKNTRKVPDCDEEEATFDFLEAVLKAIHVSYLVKHDLCDGKATFNSLLLYPFLNAVCFFVAESVAESNVEFKIETEVALLETSSHFRSNDKAKCSFDHYKSAYGSLTMMKNLADEYYFATAETFSKLKILFIHAADDKLFLRRIRFVQECSMSEMWEEKVLEINPSHSTKSVFIPKCISLYLYMKEELSKMTSCVLQLKSEHEEALKECRFRATKPSPTLKSVRIASLAIPFLRTLISLQLQNNQLTILPKELWRLEHLHEPNLDHNQLTEFPSNVGSLTHLFELYFHNNQVQQIPSQLRQLKGLSILDLTDNQLHCLPMTVRQLDLQRCWLDNNPIDAQPRSS